MSKVDDIWADDKLGRKQDAKFLEAFLVGRHEERIRAGAKGSYVLNLNAEWGFGKTFFMERLAKQLAKKHPVVFIDAWKNDFSDDPYTAVISEIEGFFRRDIREVKGKSAGYIKAYDAVKKNAGKIFWLGVKGGLKRGARWAVGEAADEIVEVVDQHVVETGATGQGLADDAEKHVVEVSDRIIDAFAEKRINDFEEAKVSLDNFRDSLSALLKAYEKQSENKLPFFVCIDELDRCRPPYAIAMLERIKHLFDADNVVFVISTDTKQLGHSIKGVYGATFDSQRYLRRFFSQTYNLPTPSNRGIIDTLIDESGVDEKKWHTLGMNEEHRRFLDSASSRFGLGPRDVKQAMQILLNLTTIWHEPCKIQLAIMYVMIIGFLQDEDITQMRLNSWISHQAESGEWIKIQNSRSGGREANSATVGQCISELIYFAGLDVSEIVERGQEEVSTFSIAQRAAFDFYMSEIRDRFPGAMPRAAKPYILSYPALIRHAGQLKEG